MSYSLCDADDLMMFAVIGLVQEEGKRGRGISSQLEITTKLAVLTFTYQSYLRSTTHNQ